MEWIKNILVDLDISRVDLVKEGADDNAFIKYFKNREGGPAMTFKEIIAKLKPEDKAVIEAELEKAKSCGAEESEVEKEKTEDETPEEKKEKTEDETPEEKREETEVTKEKEEKPEEDDMEEVFKSLDPRVKALFDAVNAKATAAEAVAKSLVEKELEAEAVAKAKEVAGIGASEEQLVKIYKSLKETNAELCSEVFGIFKTAANVKEAGEGIFDTVAKHKSGVENTAGNAWDRIMAEATEVAKAKGITEAAAVSEVVKAKPELYKEYLQELKK